MTNWRCGIGWRLEGAYLGQPVLELLTRLGPPDAARTHAPESHPRSTFPSARADTVLIYGERWITLGRDRVLRIGPAVPTQVYGPR